MSYSYPYEPEGRGITSIAQNNYPPTASCISAIPTSRIEQPAKPNVTLEVVRASSGRPHLVVSGLVFTLLAGIAFAITGTAICIISPSRAHALNLPTMLSKWLHNVDADPGKERIVIIRIPFRVGIAVELFFTTLVTVCSEVTGYVHATTLKRGLAEEDRLTFNANLRFFSTTKGIFSMNGPVVSMVHGLSLVFAYSASSSFFLRVYDADINLGFSIISFVSPMILGVALVVQAALGLVALFRTPALTWSTSPLDVTSALISHGSIRRQQKRCMRSVSKTLDMSFDPIRPSPQQPSLWASHQLVAPMVCILWSMAVLWLAFAVGVALGEWPTVHGFDVALSLSWRGGAPPIPLLYLFLLQGMMQSVVTIGVHCCELVTTLARDEAVWRKASSRKGAPPTGHPLEVLMKSGHSVSLLMAKPLIHWVFGLTVSLGAGSGLAIIASWMFILSGAMVAVAIFITVTANNRPSGPQPAAYGHIQTLTDLVDEWSTKTMHWGDKGPLGEGPWPVYHAGTTDAGVLPLVRMDEVYA
ncbi:hypothetical protein FRB96_001794 [Tulasnella sp. 330]|nr:hypothetical protein FRB96_001794 [Tulasnella sp. 330]KAG8875656.1 hypothetical protein FRB97_004840 [Tulasnella sp. 331]KAG8886975.1 hypothetical protein FRB98_000699 [Tulasnella sp. 332]